jgi:cyclin H
LWSFTAEELLEKRTQVNEKSSLKVDERLQGQPEVDPLQIEKVTVEEELQLISFHSRRIGPLARHFNMPSQVRATAISFLRKFYLVNSVMEHHPKLILLTCLFLAAKSENYFISISTFSKKTRIAAESILSLEFEVLQSLQFTLLTHHPFRPLYGFFFDIQDVLSDEYSEKELGSLYDEARKIIDETLISDAVYLYTPPQIALACYLTVNNEIVLKYLKKKFQPVDVKQVIKEETEEELEKEADGLESTEESKEPEGQSDDLVYNDLLAIIQQCQQVIKGALNPSKEEATLIDRKVQYCLNPALVLKRKRDNAINVNDSNKKPRLESVEVDTNNSTPIPAPL